MTAATPDDTPTPQTSGESGSEPTAPTPPENNPSAPENDASDASPNDSERESEDRESVDDDQQTPLAQTAGGENLVDQLAAANDRNLRLHAELENFRKRSQRLMDEQRRYAALPLLRDLLAVVDNLQRALDAAQPSEPNNGLLEGVTMVAEQLQGVLQRHDCRKIDAHGQRFDPSVHQAMLQMPSAEQSAGTVMQVTQEGYLLHDRVVRPSQVMVSSAPVEPDASEPTADDGAEPPASSES